MKTRSRTPLFLIELTIMLIVFAVVAAVCLRLFARARTVSEDSGKLSHSVSCAQTMADCFRAAGGDIALTAEYANGELSEGLVLCSYDADWQPCGSAETEYTLTLTPEGESGAVVSVHDNGGVELFLLRTEALLYG